jgi:hypothetical protein
MALPILAIVNMSLAGKAVVEQGGKAANAITELPPAKQPFDINTKGPAGSAGSATQDDKLMMDSISQMMKFGQKQIPQVSSKGQVI